jgi:hypothetical protein
MQVWLSLTWWPLLPTKRVPCVQRTEYCVDLIHGPDVRCKFSVHEGIQLRFLGKQTEGLIQHL